MIPTNGSLLALLRFVTLIVLGFSVHQATAQNLATAEKLSDGIIVRYGDSILKVEVCTDSVIHVAFAKDRAFFARKSLSTSPRQCEATQRLPRR